MLFRRFAVAFRDWVVLIFILLLVVSPFNRHLLQDFVCGGSYAFLVQISPILCPHSTDTYFRILYWGAATHSPSFGLGFSRL